MRRGREGQSSPEASVTKFGHLALELMTEMPLGSLTKRETELKLLAAAIDAGIIEATPEDVARFCRVTISRAVGYLTDLALRTSPLEDAEAVLLLLTAAAAAEVVAEGKHLSIPLYDARLRVWTERQIAARKLNSGDVMRKDHFRVTPAGLGVILGAANGLSAPERALKQLPRSVRNAEWYKLAEKEWGATTSWTEALSGFSSAATVIEFLSVTVPVLARVVATVVG